MGGAIVFFGEGIVWFSKLGFMMRYIYGLLYTIYYHWRWWSLTLHIQEQTWSLNSREMQCPAVPHGISDVQWIERYPIFWDCSHPSPRSPPLHPKAGQISGKCADMFTFYVILSPLILTVQKEQNRGFTLKFHLESSKQLSFATEFSKKQGFSHVLPMPYPTKAVLFWTQAPAAQSLELYGVLRHDPDAARQSMQCGGQ